MCCSKVARSHKPPSDALTGDAMDNFPPITSEDYYTADCSQDQRDAPSSATLLTTVVLHTKQAAKSSQDFDQTRQFLTFNPSLCLHGEHFFRWREGRMGSTRARYTYIEDNCTSLRDAHTLLDNTSRPSPLRLRGLLTSAWTPTSGPSPRGLKPSISKCSHACPNSGGRPHVATTTVSHPISGPLIEGPKISRTKSSTSKC